MDFKELKNPPKKYRPIPFWSWNEKLYPEETKSQIRDMEKAGIGGYFMHARGGLQTEYMSDEWFQNVRASLSEGEKQGMYSWGYDESGWPSGFAAGAVNALGEKYQQKYLRFEETKAPKETDTTVCNIYENGKNYHLYYEINPYYVDTLDGSVTDKFIELTHEVYLSKLGKEFPKMTGFFTDEPQIARAGLPWSFILESEFKKAYGYEITEYLHELFIDVGSYKKTRYNYYKLIRDLFSQNFMKKIYDWCEKNGSSLTGHLVCEEGGTENVIANGACMPHYEYFHIPGMDHLGRSLASEETMMQLSSACAQLNKKQVLSETFALSGWNVSFEDLRYIYEWQMVHGINLLCQHLEGYSLRGIRKRDYPASLFRQQPWWDDYRLFNDAVSRMGMLISEGKEDTKTLLLYGIESVWTDFKYGPNKASRRLFMPTLHTMKTLEDAQIPYHLGDEALMRKYGSVEDGLLKVGAMSYDTVVVPPSSCFGESTYALLKSFSDCGGKIIFAGAVPHLINGEETDLWEKIAESSVKTDRKGLVSQISDKNKPISLSGKGKKNIRVLKRVFSDKGITMLYLFNKGDESLSLSAKTMGKGIELFNMFSGETEATDFSENDGLLKCNLFIEAHGSVVLFVYDKKVESFKTKSDNEKISLNHKLKGAFEISSMDLNTLTLDYCDLYFEDKLYGENVPISDVQEIACGFGREIKCETVFKFNVESLDLGSLFLCVETPEIYTVKVNGKEIEKNIEGYLRDVSFKKMSIRDYIKEGKNEISLICNFSQKEETYDNIRKSQIFETERNKLSYDMEIEAIYLAGDFSVLSDKPLKEIENDALRAYGSFSLAKTPTQVCDGSLEAQGFPFFCGKISLKKTVLLSKDEAEGGFVELEKMGATVTSVRVNGKDMGKIMWQPYKLDLSSALVEGENEIEITLTTNLRNLLGPFHLKEGECMAVCPGHFFHKSLIWTDKVFMSDNPWDDGYCFVKHGLFLK